MVLQRARATEHRLGSASDGVLLRNEHGARCCWSGPGRSPRGSSHRVCGVQPSERDHGGPCVGAFCLSTQTGSEQQRSSQQVKDARCPPTEQGVPELPAWHHLRHRLVVVPNDSKVSDTGHRNHPQDPGCRTQHRPCSLHGLLVAVASQMTRGAADELRAGDGQQEAAQSHYQHQTHEDPAQFNVQRQAQDAAVGPALQSSQLLDHTGPPQTHFIAFSWQQLSRGGQPCGH